MDGPVTLQGTLTNVRLITPIAFELWRSIQETPTNKTRVQLQVFLAQKILLARLATDGLYRIDLLAMDVLQVVDQVAPIAETFRALVAEVYPIGLGRFEVFVRSVRLGPMGTPPGSMGKAFPAVVTFVLLRVGCLGGGFAFD